MSKKFARESTLPVAEHQTWSPSEKYRVDFAVYEDGALGVSVLDYVEKQALSAVLEPGSIDRVINTLITLKHDAQLKETK